MELCPHVHMDYSHGKATVSSVCIVAVAQLPRLRETLMTVPKVLS